MNPTLRRALLIAGFAAAIFAFAWIIWVVFFKPPAPTTTKNANGFVNGLPVPGTGNVNRTQPGNANVVLPNVNVQDTGQEPSTIAKGGTTLVKTLVNTNTGGLTVNGNNGLQFYDKKTGQFFQISPDGVSQTPLTDAIYKDVQQITWSPDGSKAILQFPDNSKILYDFANKKQTTLPKELNNFSFSPHADQMVSKFLDAVDAQNQWLVITKPDGSQSQTVEQLGQNAAYVTPAWSPNDQIVATYQKVINGTQSQIIFLGPNGENLPSVNVPGLGFTPNWSPDGRRLLYSTYSDNTNGNPHLFIMNGSPDSLGSGQMDLGIDTTADKCAFSPNGYALYCAVPYYLNPGSGPQPELSAGIPDNIYKIDLLSGTSTLIARPVDGNRNQRFSAANIRVDAQENALFFTDATTGAVQRIQLR